MKDKIFFIHKNKIFFIFSTTLKKYVYEFIFCFIYLKTMIHPALNSYNLYNQNIVKYFEKKV